MKIKTPLKIPFKDLNVAPKEEVSDAFYQFCTTIATLRNKHYGCPWDLQQNHKSLRAFMLEESYEAAHAMGKNDDKEICEELGDVLLQVVLNAQVALDDQRFTITDVIKAINSKMIARHPHVFMRSIDEERLTPEEVLNRWDEVKKKEQLTHKGSFTEKDYFKTHQVDKVFPASLRAARIGELAKKVSFDWPDLSGVWTQFLDEVEELKHEIKSLQKKKSKKTLAKVKEEIGDIYFTVAQLCRHLDFSAEEVASDANEKFLLRFSTMEKLIATDKKKLSQVSNSDLEIYWKKAKKLLAMKKSK